MTDRKLEAILQDLQAFITREVAAAFSAQDQLVDYALEMYCDQEEPAVLRPYAERLARELITSHLQQQRTWPEVTDCDRLDQAFAELENRGILCRQNFSCCGTCGATEIWGEIEAARAEGREILGYAFHHHQETENAVEGGGLFLGYGAVLKSEKTALDIARQIVEVIERHGLSTDWDGTWDQRIGVRLDWKRRRSV